MVNSATADSGLEASRDDEVTSSQPSDIVVSTPEEPGLHGLPDDGLPAPKPSKNKQKPTSWGFHDVGLSVDSMVGVTRLELATSRPPAVRATSCATPRQHHYYSIPIAVSSKDVFVECKLNTILLRGRHRSYCKKHTHIEAFARYQALNGLARAAIGDFFYTILLPG